MFLLDARFGDFIVKDRDFKIVTRPGGTWYRERPLPRRASEEPAKPTQLAEPATPVGLAQPERSELIIEPRHRQREVAAIPTPATPVVMAKQGPEGQKPEEYEWEISWTVGTIRRCCPDLRDRYAEDSSRQRDVYQISDAERTKDLLQTKYYAVYQDPEFRIIKQPKGTDANRKEERQVPRATKTDK
jgi:hypothetical protein